MSDFNNEISRELVGPSNLNVFAMHDSASRIAMANKQVGQAVVILDPDVPRFLSGVEREYAKFTHGVKMPCHGRIVKVLQKYPPSIADVKERRNPKYLVIFENREREFGGVREFDCLEIDAYHRLHQTWGHRQVEKSGWSKLAPDEYVARDTPLAGSPNVTEEGDYRFGVEANVALMSHPVGIEDGIGIREGYLDKLKTRAYGRRVVSYSDGKFPLNLYGDENTYKAFPDIGDTVRSDGLLFATRQYDEALGPLQLTPKSTRKPVKLFDDPVYAVPDAKVVDVIVYRGDVNKTQMPTGTFDQIQKYYKRSKQYYHSIIHEYRTLVQKYGQDDVEFSPRFLSMVEEAEFYCYENNRDKIEYSVKKVPVGEWYVEVIFEYEVRPTYGSKMSGLSGDKGVIVSVIPDEEMPFDDDGNMADIIMDADSTIKRMNTGRLYRQYASASARATQRRIQKMLGNNPKDKDYLEAFDYALGWYQIASPEMHKSILDVVVHKEEKIRHIKEVAKNGFYVYRPLETSEPAPEMIKKMLDHYPATYSTLNITLPDGSRDKTKLPILIGSMYMLLLDKLANTYSAVASPRFQHHGIPAKVSAMDKYSAPGRSNPLRVFGETEFRILTCVGAGPAAVDMHDQSNNPSTQREVVRSIHQAGNPMQIPEVVDRKKNPYGYARPHLYINHNLACAGVRFVTKKRS